MAFRYLTLTLSVFLWTAISAGAQTVSVNGETPPNVLTVGAATSVAIAVSDGPGNTTDWIALYPIGAADSGYLSWSYLSGTGTPPSSGLTSVTFTTYAPVTPGDYEWRLFANDGWTRIATSSVVTVTASAAVLTVNGVTAPSQASVGAGGSITVSLAAGPGNPTDWIGLAPAGSPDSTLVDWRYLNGTTVPPAAGLSSGTVQFLAPATPGSYEVRLFAHGTFTRVATATINVSASTAAITVDDNAPPTAVSVVAGTHVGVGITGGPAQPGDWVGLFAANAADSANLAWRYLNGSTTIPSNGQSDAQLIFAAPVTAGSYEFRFFNANTFTRLATSTTMVVSASSAALSVNGVAAPASATAAAGSQAVVGLDGGPANVGDWVGLYLVGAPDGAVLDWRYLNDTAQLPATGLSTSTLHFVVPTTPGTYEFRFFAEDGGLLSTSGNLVVPQTVAQISVNGVAPPTTVSVAPGNTLTVQIAGGPANPTDWLALAAQTAPNSNFVAWQYLNGSSSPPSTGLSSATLSFVLPSEAGTYELRLFAQNSYQRITTSSAITASTGPPQVTVSMTSPFPGTTFNAPSSVLLSASASIAGGTISRVDFYSGSTLIGSASAPPYAANWVSPSQAVHVLTAAVVDSTTAVTTSAPITITVAPPGAGEGTLGAPIASPPGGAFSQPPQVTLAAQPTAAIRYTLDGSEPTAPSTLYTEPIAIPSNGATLKARAFQAGWVESAIVSATYVIDATAPTIVATVSPKANAAGWHNTTVTVTFACADNVSVSTCPAPATVSGEGAAQLVSAAAIDGAGNQAPISVSISLDRTAPSVAIPAELPAEVTSAALSFDASVSDSLSGLSGATCNGLAPQAITNPITCSLTLQKGRNILVVAARDAAGNVGSDSAMIGWIPTAAATSLTVSPVSAGLIVGESRTFSVKDDQGRIVSATWESSDPEVVDWVEGRATALAPGEATLTATAGGLVATTSVVVYAGPFMTAGASRWSNPSSSGASGTADTVILNAFEGDGPSLLSIEYTSEWRFQPLVRGLAADGSELWSGGLPMGPSESVYDVPLADPFGGVVALVGDFSTTSQSIVRAGWSEGVPSWRRDLPPQVIVYALKQASDGMIYSYESAYEFNEFQEESPFIYTSSDDIVAMDGRTGEVRFRKRLPTWTSFQWRPGYLFQDVYVTGAADGMTVSSDGFVYVTTTSGFSDDFAGQTWRDTQLMRIDPTGETVSEQLWQGGGPLGSPFQLRIDNMQSDGAGGVFFQMAAYDPTYATSPVVTGRYRSTTFSNDFEMAQGVFGSEVTPFSAHVTSIDSNSVSSRQFGDLRMLLSFNMRSGAVHWERETSEVATVSRPGGGAVLVDGFGGYRTIGPSGAIELAENLGIGVGEYAFGRFHARDVDRTLKAVPWKPLDDATAFAGGQKPAVKQYGLHAKAHNVSGTLGLYKHLGLALVPRNQDFWLSQNNQWHTYFKRSEIYNDSWVVTTGGNYIGTMPFWKLTQEWNKQPGDFTEQPNPGLWLNVENEDNKIGEVLIRSLMFPDGVLDYSATAQGETGEPYNSNSFMRGLLDVCRIPLPPWFKDGTFPGAQKPVPSQYFPVP